MGRRERPCSSPMPAITVAKANQVAILGISGGKRSLDLEFGFGQRWAPVFEQFVQCACSSELCATSSAVEGVGV
jgi:hypothetical protein